jgi:uncharacterized protein DUF4331/flagellar hook capping protein FlgD
MTPRRLAARALAVLLAALLAHATAGASSHSEAPGTAKDRLADDTDLYAWVAADAPDAVTFVGNWVPLLEPASGPNFSSFDDQATYWFNIDNVGDAQDHIRYEFSFHTTRKSGATFLYNTGVVTSVDSPNLNVLQTYTVTRWDGATPTVLGVDLPVAPSFVGRVSMPDYGFLAQTAVRTLSDGSKVFVGPRDDPFFVDLSSIFDLLTIRRPPGNRGKGVDDLAGFNVMSIVLQVPKTRLTSDGQASGASNAVIGIYSSAERPSQRTLNADGTITTGGAPVQVSRLGNPLVNEVVIPLKDKDRFNAAEPAGDGQFLPYVLDPELAHLLTLLYGIQTPPAPRNDLVAIFLTGIAGLNQPANPHQSPCEMLRLNMSIAPAKSPSRLGVLGGDVAGFPNGRRLADDVVDIAERAVAGATPFTAAFNVAPNNQLGDGVDANDRPFLPYFPYVAPPQDPAGHQHHVEQHAGVDLGAIGARGADAERGEVSGSALALRGANPATASKLEFTLPANGHVKLEVFDVQGRIVRTLLDQDAAAGAFVTSWDGTTDGGARVVGGVYFARLTAGAQVTSRRIVLQ